MVLFICQCSTRERLSLRLWLTLLPGKKAKGKEAIRRNKFHRAEVPILKLNVEPLYEEKCLNFAFNFTGKRLKMATLRHVRPHVTIPVRFLLDAEDEYFIITVTGLPIWRVAG